MVKIATDIFEFEGRVYVINWIIIMERGFWFHPEPPAPFQPGLL